MYFGRICGVFWWTIWCILVDYCVTFLALTFFSPFNTVLGSTIPLSDEIRCYNSKHCGNLCKMKYPKSTSAKVIIHYVLHVLYFIHLSYCGDNKNMSYCSLKNSLYIFLVTCRKLVESSYSIHFRL